MLIIHTNKNSQVEDLKMAWSYISIIDDVTELNNNFRRNYDKKSYDLLNEWYNKLAHPLATIIKPFINKGGKQILE